MDEFQREIEELNAKNNGGDKRRFQAVDTGVLNCVFIKTNVCTKNNSIHLKYSSRVHYFTTFS